MNFGFLGLSPRFLQDARKVAFEVLASVAVGHFLGGPILAITTFFCLRFASSEQNGPAVVFALLIPMLTNLTYQIVSHGTAFMPFNKICSLLVLLPLMTAAARVRRRQALPLSMLWLYCGIAAVSSAGGWCPPISYMKLVLFLAYMVGLVFMTSAIQQSERTLAHVRLAFLIFASLYIGGSVLTFLAPGIGYQMYNAYSFSGTLTLDEMVSMGGQMLFSGVCFHSQALAPIVAVFNAWVLCDLLFIERRLTKLHAFLLAMAPLLIYKTGSRTGFLVYVSSMSVVALVSLPRARIPVRVKQRVTSFFYGLCVLLVLGAVILEVNGGYVTAFLRKTDVESAKTDQRDLLEAVTASRQGSNEENLRYFRENMLLGKGFQTMEWHADAYATGGISIWSAPLEKGVLPLAILGETGLVGAVVFLIFVFQFYSFCLARRYTASLSTFTALLMSNMGECTFFSTTATGGVLLAVAFVGGFCIDMLAARQDQSRPFVFPWRRVAK